MRPVVQVACVSLVSAVPAYKYSIHHRVAQRRMSTPSEAGSTFTTQKATPQRSVTECQTLALHDRERHAVTISASPDPKKSEATSSLSVFNRLRSLIVQNPWLQGALEGGLGKAASAPFNTLFVSSVTGSLPFYAAPFGVQWIRGAFSGVVPGILSTAITSGIMNTLACSIKKELIEQGVSETPATFTAYSIGMPIAVWLTNPFKVLESLQQSGRTGKEALNIVKEHGKRSFTLGLDTTLSTRGIALFSTFGVYPTFHESVCRWTNIDAGKVASQLMTSVSFSLGVIPLTMGLEKLRIRQQTADGPSLKSAIQSAVTSLRNVGHQSLPINKQWMVRQIKDYGWMGCSFVAFCLTRNLVHRALETDPA